MICVNSVEVFPKTITIEKGEFFYDFGAEVCPADADCKSSDNEAIAAVNPDTGYIYAKEFGTTTIWATATDGGGCQGGIVARLDVIMISVNTKDVRINTNNSRGGEDILGNNF